MSVFPVYTPLLLPSMGVLTCLDEARKNADVFLMFCPNLYQLIGASPTPNPGFTFLSSHKKVNRKKEI